VTRLVERLARRRRDPIIILPYLGYGTPGSLTVRGRVLEDEGFLPAADADTRWRNLVRFYKRLESDEVPGARLVARFGNLQVETRTDGEGYFRMQLDAASASSGWKEVDLELLDPPGATRATARVLVPSSAARFGVISDIDDTIVASNVTKKLRMILTVALTNARTRKPFRGVAAFYRALHAAMNPIFYVSKSPWNLYVPLVEYLEVQRLPLGPLMLRDFGFFSDKNHKTQAIEDILATYPGMKFVLIGDDGEHDPEIYCATARRHPGRIRAIYIRSAKPSLRRIAGCDLVQAPEAESVAQHAAAQGLIQASELRAVRAEKAWESSASKAAASSDALK
jgi:phosphatidate phosphatase APP1